MEHYSTRVQEPVHAVTNSKALCAIAIADCLVLYFFRFENENSSVVHTSTNSKRILNPNNSFSAAGNKKEKEKYLFNARYSKK